jgi:hypothetical protein
MPRQRGNEKHGIAEINYDFSFIPSFLDANPTIFTWVAEGSDGMKRAADYLEELTLGTQGILFDQAADKPLPKKDRNEIERILREAVEKADMVIVRARAKGLLGDMLADIASMPKIEREKLGRIFEKGGITRAYNRGSSRK